MRKIVASVVMLISIFMLQLSFAADNPISTNVTVDTTPPTIRDVYVGDTGGDSEIFIVDQNATQIPITFYGLTDGTGSGLDHIEYTIRKDISFLIDGTVNLTNTDSSKTINIDFPGDGYYSVTAKVYDKLGNYSQMTKTRTVARQMQMNVVATDYVGTYDGQPHYINVVVNEPTTNYTIKYGTTPTSCNSTSNIGKVNAGTYRVYFEITTSDPRYVTYSGSATITINPYQILDADIYPSIFTYNGSENRPSVRAEAFGSPLVSTDYIIAYDNNINASTASYVPKAKITFRGNYSGYVEKTFTILPKELTVKARNTVVTAGSAVPQLQLDAYGLVNGETISTSGSMQTTYTSSSPAGSYPITRGSLALSSSGSFIASNYDMTFVDGTIIVPDGGDDMHDDILLDSTPPSAELEFGTIEDDGSVDLTAFEITDGVGTGVVRIDWRISKYNESTGAYDLVSSFDHTTFYTTPPTEDTYNISGIEETKYKGEITVWDFAGNQYTTSTTADFSKKKLKVDPINEVFTYNGSVHTPLPTVRDRRTNAVLTNGVDYDLTYYNNVFAGTARVKVEGINDYGGSAIVTFDILKKDINVHGVDNQVSYGAAVPTVDYDYDITDLIVADRPTEANKKSIFTGNITTAPSPIVTNVPCSTFAIQQGTLALISSIDENYNLVYTNGTLKISADVTSIPYSGEYDGEEHGITVNVDTNNKPYTIMYGETAGNYTSSTNIMKTNAGTYTIFYKVSVSGFDDVTGSNTITITKPTITDATIYPTTYRYNGGPNTPSVSVYASSFSTDPIDSSNYIVAYSNNIDANTSTNIPTVTITGTGNFIGTITKTFTIEPQELIIVADSHRIRVGSSVPTLTFQAYNLVGSETISTSGSMQTTYTPSSPAGSYPITSGNLALSSSGTFKASNYTFEFVGSNVVAYEDDQTEPIHDDILLDTTPPVGELRFGVRDIVTGEAPLKAYNLTDGTGSGIVRIDWEVSMYDENSDSYVHVPRFDYTTLYSTSPTQDEITLSGVEKGLYKGLITITDAVGNQSTAQASIDYRLDSRSMEIEMVPYVGTYDKLPHTATINMIDPIEDYEITYSSEESGTYTTTPIYGTNAGYYDEYLKITAYGYNDLSRGTYISILPKPISSSDITKTLSTTSFEFDGTVQIPDVELKYGDYVLEEGEDYTISLSGDGINYGTHRLVIQGIGNYTDQVTLNYSITRRIITLKINSAEKYFGDPDPLFTAEILNLYPEDDYGFEHLIEGEFTRDPGEQIGSYTIRIGTAHLVNYLTFNTSNYQLGNIVLGSLTIKAVPLSGTMVINPTTYVYNGGNNEPTVTITLSDSTTLNPSYYAVSYENNKDVGTATAIATGRNGYTGVLLGNFAITPRPITYTPNPVTITYRDPIPTTFNYSITGDGLVAGETPTYGGSITTTATATSNVGTYPILLNNFTISNSGTFKTSNYEITKDDGVLTIVPYEITPLNATLTLNPTTYIYDGAEKQPDTTVTLTDGTVLTRGTDYTVSYSNNINVGTATATITGTGNYTGSLSGDFTITPATITLSVTVDGTGDLGTPVIARPVANPSNSTLTYQWYRTTEDTPTNGVPISGATNVSYTIQSADTNKRVYVVVTASKENYIGATASAMAPLPREGNPPTVPTLTAKLDNSSGATYTSGTWTNHNIWLQINSTDDTRVPKYEYSTVGQNSGFIEVPNFENETGTMTVETNQNLVTYYFRAIDIFGNISNTSSIVLGIDKDAPIVTEVYLIPNTWTNQEVVVNARATDTLSGVNGYFFGTTVTGTFTNISPAAQLAIKENTYTENSDSLYYVVRDQAGNIGYRQFEVWNIDKVPPVITLSSVSSETKIVVTVDVTDDLSGVDKLLVNDVLDESFAYVGEGRKQSIIEVTEPGLTEFLSNDNAGNRTVEPLQVYGVIYNGNGIPGTMMPQLKLGGDSVIIKESEFTTAEYMFVEWNTNKDGSGRTYHPGDVYSDNEVLTLYAQWVEIPKTLDRVVLNRYEFAYTGSVIIPQEKVYNTMGQILTRDLHYDIVFENNINVGIANAIVTGIGPYAGQRLETTFKIVGTNIENVRIELEPQLFVYDGRAKRPKVTVTLGNEVLISGIDYVVDYENNVNAGTATAIITGRGRYYGVANKEFTIIKADRELTVYDIGMIVGDQLELEYGYVGETAPVTVTIGNTSIARATLNGSKVTLSAVSDGRTTISYSVDESRNYNSATGLAQIVVFPTKEEAHPVYGTILINNDDEYTNTPRTVLYIRAFCADYMYLSTENVKPSGDNEEWNDYTTRLPYEFSSQVGEKVIYAWFKDTNGNISNVASDTIILDYNHGEPAHDSIMLDTTSPNTTAPTIDFKRFYNDGMDISVDMLQQDELSNGVRSGIDKSTVQYGYKETGSSFDYEWSYVPRINGLDYGVEYDFVTQAKDRAGNGPTISTPYSIIMPVRYVPAIQLRDTNVQNDGRIHEIDPASFDLVTGYPLDESKIKYTYYIDPACTIETTIAKNGSEVQGGPPSKPGTYYVKVTVVGDPNYLDAESNVGELRIGWFIGADSSREIFSYVKETVPNSDEYILKVIGSGRMLDLEDIRRKNTEESYTYWVDFKNKITELDIGPGEYDNVTTIGASVFTDLTKITEIIIPETVTKIGNSAFNGDTAVNKKVIIPASVNEIGINPFVHVNTPEFEVRYGSNRFDTINGVLVSKEHEDLISYPAGKEETEYEIPDTIKIIKTNSFYGNEHLEHVVIPNGVETIGGRAFYECKELSVVEVLDLMENDDTTKNLRTIANESFDKLKPVSSIYTFSKDVADMFVKDVTYDHTLTTVYYPPVITLQPIDMNGEVGARVKFIVEARKGYVEDLFYEWHVVNSGVDRVATGSGVTQSEYTTSALTSSNEGDEYYCVVYNMPYYHEKGYSRSEKAKLIMIDNANYMVERGTYNSYLFNTLQEAMDYAITGDNIRVLKDVPHEGNAVLNGNKTITFTGTDLSGIDHTVAMDGIIEIPHGSNITFQGGGTITKDENQFSPFVIQNNGVITMNGNMTISYPTGGGINVQSGATLSVLSGTITANSDAILNTNGRVIINGSGATIKTSSTGITHAITLNNNARLDMFAGTVSASSTDNFDVTGIYLNGSVNGKITILGGEVTATSNGTQAGVAIVNAGSSDVTISGGTFRGTKAGIETAVNDRYGDIFLKAGTVEGGKYGILNSAYNAKIVLGISDKNVTDSTPVVRGEVVAIYNAKKQDTLEFYDGTLYSRGTNIIYEMLLDYNYEVSPAHPERLYKEEGRENIITETGYSIFVDALGGYNRATLKQGRLPILDDLEDVTVEEGEQADFEFGIRIPGHPDEYTFTWEVSTDGGNTWTAITIGSGLGTMHYRTPPTSLSMDGYFYRCKVTSAAGSVYTRAAKLTVSKNLEYKDQRPIVRISYTNDRVVVYDDDNKFVDMQIVIKSFADISKIDFTYNNYSLEFMSDNILRNAGSTKHIEPSATDAEKGMHSFDIKNVGKSVIDKGNSLVEYTYTYDLKVRDNGVITVTATDVQNRERTASQAVDIIYDLNVTHTISKLNNIKKNITITFIANKPVRPTGSSVNGIDNAEYAKLVGQDSSLYSNRFTYDPDGPVPLTKFTFEDEFGNVTSDYLEELLRVKYRDIKFNGLSTESNNINDLSVIDAYEIANNLEIVTEQNENLDLQSRYGVNKVQVDMYMGKARDIGAANILSSATTAKSFDGVYTKDIVAKVSKDDNYDYVRGTKATYMATVLDVNNQLTNESSDHVDKISKSKNRNLYKGQYISGFVDNEPEPYMYSDSAGNAHNVDNNIHDITFRAVIEGN